MACQKGLLCLLTVALLCGNLAQAQTLDEVQAKIVSQHQARISNLSQNQSTNPGLFEALSDLGHAYLAMGATQEAAAVFEQGLQIAKVNFGLYSRLQLPVIEHLSQIYFDMGDWAIADRWQKYAYLIRLRSQGRDSESVNYASVTSKRGDWYTDTKRPASARGYYLSAVKWLEQQPQPDTARLVQLLIKVSDTYQVEYNEFDLERQITNSSNISRLGARREYTTIIANDSALPPALPTGVRTLQKALTLAIEHPQENGKKTQADIHVALGDWYVILDRPVKANEAYQSAIALLTPNQQQIDQLFDHPKLLRFFDPMPKRSTLTSEILIELSYTVEPNGKVQNLVVTEAKPQRAFQFKLATMRHFARYRPAFKNGKAVAVNIKRHYKYNREQGLTYISHKVDDIAQP